MSLLNVPVVTARAAIAFVDASGAKRKISLPRAKVNLMPGEAQAAADEMVASGALQLDGLGKVTAAAAGGLVKSTRTVKFEA